jgi:predicted nuclease with TOPRIM domain
MKCEFCDKDFSNKYILLNHQKTTKYCLDIQSKLLETKYNCKYCKKNFTTEQRVISHSKICKNKLINIEELVENNNKMLYKNKELEKELLEKNNRIKELELKNKELEDKLYKILEKAVDKPTNNNYI